MIKDTMSRLMQAYAMTQTELANKTKLTQATIQRLQSGDTDNPTLKNLIPIADFFSISIDQLVGRAPISGMDQVPLTLHTPSSPQVAMLLRKISERDQRSPITLDQVDLLERVVDSVLR